MKLWRLITLVAGGGMLVVLGAAALIVWPLLWPPDPDASVQLVNGRLMGEVTGYVGRVDRDGAPSTSRRASSGGARCR